MTTFQQIYKQVQGFVGDRSDDTLTKIKQWINEGVRDIWVAHEWAFKRATMRVNTVAPYSTGTVTVAKGSSTVTISGGSFSGLTGYKFASAIGEPYFRISDVAGDGLSCTLEAAFTETSLSGSTFICYKDEYSLGTSVESVEAARLIQSGEGGLRHVRLSETEIFDSVPQTTDTPSYYYLAAAGSNTIYLGLVDPPDDVYPIDVRYERKPTDMSADEDTPSLPDEFVPLIVNFAVYKASLYDKAEFNAQMMYQDYKVGLAEKIRQVQPKKSQVFTFKPFDMGRKDTDEQPWPGGWF